VPVPPEVLAALHPEERSVAETLHGFRQEAFVGGRMALATAIAELGARSRAVPVGGRGEPVLPSGLVGSVSHKRDLAVAIVARAGTSIGLGVDLEDVGLPRDGVARRVLRAEELAAAEALPEDRRWVDVVTRFAVKEAIYKALAPTLQRMIHFEEAAVWPSPDGIDRVELHLAGASGGDGPSHEGAYTVEARHAWIGARVLATVRIARR
jgi:4'-phosphopantetheinyl transferase EntD